MVPVREQISMIIMYLYGAYSEGTADMFATWKAVKWKTILSFCSKLTKLIDFIFRCHVAGLPLALRVH